MLRNERKQPSLRRCRRASQASASEHISALLLSFEAFLRALLLLLLLLLPLLLWGSGLGAMPNICKAENACRRL